VLVVRAGVERADVGMAVNGPETLKAFRRVGQTGHVILHAQAADSLWWDFDPPLLQRGIDLEQYDSFAAEFLKNSNEERFDLAEERQWKLWNVNAGALGYEAQMNR